MQPGVTEVGLNHKTDKLTECKDLLRTDFLEVSSILPIPLPPVSLPAVTHSFQPSSPSLHLLQLHVCPVVLSLG